MSTNVWKIGQDVSASDYFKNSKFFTYTTEGEGDNAKTTLVFSGFNWSTESAANKMTEICNEMATEYATAVGDANSYLLEINSSIDELNNLQENVKEQIAKLEKEIAELNKKKEDGTITEDEENELNSKQEELNSLTSNTDTQIGTKTTEISTTVTTASTIISENKESIATDYGNTAITKGDELAQTQDKRKSFFRKLFKTWDKSGVRKAGTNLAEAGTNLLDNVTDGKSVVKEIANKTKNFNKESV